MVARRRRHYDRASPAALLATKCHAVGYARSQRRATKHGADMLDVYRLVDAYNLDGELATELHEAPGRLAPVIADVVRTEILANPARPPPPWPRPAQHRSPPTT